MVFQKEKIMNPKHIKYIGRVLAVMLLLALLTGITPGAVLPAYASLGNLTRVSVDSSGAQANGASQNSQLSGDGRYVVFESLATNLVADDTNNLEDIFVKDLQTGATTRVSLASLTGAQANGDSRGAAISSDGRYVAFESAATNLVSVDTNGQNDVFVRDLQTGITTLVSVDSAGVQASGVSKNSPIPISISGDGRFVVFTSRATNLVSGDTNAAEDVFMHDMQTGTTTLVSVDSFGVQGNNTSSSPEISVNGRYVVFASPAANFVDGDTNEARDVFVRDLQTGQTTRVSVNSDGVQADEGAWNPSISGDGRYVSFLSSAHNLMSVNTQDFEYIYVRDCQSGTTTVASFDNGDPMHGWMDNEVISADGRYIAFTFDDKGDGEAVTWNYVHDRLSDQNILPANLRDSGAPYRLSLSADGLYFSFDTKGDLVPDDTNGVRDVFVKTMIYPPDLNPTVTSVECYSGCSGYPDQVTEQVANFAVEFSENVTGVDPSDFSLTMTGSISGAAITGVSGTSSRARYDIFVDTGTGDGTLRLDVLDDDTIRDYPQNPLGGIGLGNGSFTSIYPVDKSLPVVTGIVRADPNPTVSGSVNFSVTFSEDVTRVDASDFALDITGGISGAVVAEVIGSGKNYTVMVNTGTGDGTLRLDLIDDQTIYDSVFHQLGEDGAGNGNYTLGEAYTVDRNAPVVLRSLRADANPTTADSVSFNVTFSEAVSGVDASDFLLTTTDRISGASIIVLSGSANTYTVTAATGSGNGGLRLDLIDNDSIVDSVNKPLGGLGLGNGSFTVGEAYTINKLIITLVNEEFRSTGSGDGWVLELTENSNLGGSKNSNASFFKLGDDVQDRQFRSILHFPTYYLPDNAVVTQAILMIKKQDVVGTDPFTTHQNISVDIRKGLFGNFSLFKFGSLQPPDFEAPADMYLVGTIQNNPVSDWYWTLLDSRSFPYINLTDVTQLRLGFQLDDNDDLGDDYIRFYSGDYDAQKDRPHLLIEYYVPR
jgi:hypothetical protein